MGRRRLRQPKAIVILFLLMLMFPAQVPGLTKSPSSASPSSQASAAAPGLASQGAGASTSLPPGIVSYSNSWNSTGSQSCPRTPSQALSQVAVSSTLSVSIPRLLMMGSPVGQEIQQSYTFYKNGTLAAADGSGVALNMQLAGLPAGTLGTALSANTTAALEEYAVSSPGGGSVANITAAYAVTREYCQPSGLSIVISGHIDWPSGRGTLALRFGEKPSTVEPTRAWFGTNATRELGLDWSDSLALNPYFNSTGDELSYVVGDDFTIDPSVVTSSAGVDASAATSQTKLFYVNSGYLAFFSDGTNMLCSSSTNGSSWSSPTTIRAATHGDYFTVALSGSTIAYAYAGGSTTSFAYRYGTVPSPATCSITWGISETTQATTNSNAGIPTAALDSNADLWVSVNTYDGTNSHLEVWELSTSWAKSKDVTLSAGANPGIGVLLNLGSTKLGYVYSSNWSTAGILSIITYSGTAWSSSVSTTSTYEMAFSAATALGSTIEFCGVSTTTAKFWSFAYGGSSSPVETTLASGLVSGQDACTITTDGHSELTAVVQAGSSTLDYLTSVNKGASWSPLQVLSSTENSIQSSSVGTLGSLQMLAPGGLATAVWTAGSGPYSVRFASFPAVVPTAASSGKAWSAPGLSPYEQYFQHLTEYVSPGNGLLSVEQGDLLLPGRGMDLAITRVYSSPYGFRSSSPFEYDNYTGANLGNGWSLNFPWLGANYLHLADGEAYPYNWNGSSFVYHGATNFDLVHNTGGTYTLFMPSGVQYGYATNESLLSITDRTGNNTISFKYSSGHISKIIDTIGRTVTFSYNGNGQLSSISTGSRTWTYGYLDSNLVSSTDPTGRVTRYEYNAGVNRWLLTGIIYPTLGGVTYTYGSAPVGTEVRTYYVNLMDSYASPLASSLSASTSIAYSIVNGGVVWSNATIADGSGTNQAHKNFHAVSASNYTRIYDQNGTAALDRITENDYDSSGRLNETKLLSPSNALLAYSTSSYDNWGNLVSSRNLIGDQTWFSYANTNSQNTFGSSGFSNSFYTPLSISTNIHDALVGEASLQNGTGSAAMETYYKYSAAGNLLESKQLNGSSSLWLLTDYTYDSFGNRITMTDPLGRTTYTHYSSTYSHAYPTLTSIIVNSVNVTSSRTYDSSTGNLLSQTDPDSHTTSYSYDSLNRVLTITYPAVAGVSSVETYVYNDTHNFLTMTDPNGNLMKQSFDGLGRVTSVQRYNGSSVYSTQLYTYNWDNLVASNTTAAGSIYSYTYDQDGRLIKTTNPGGSSTVTRSYDDVNNIKTVTDENGHEKQYVYGWNGLLASVREYYKTGAYNTTSYQYDLTGNLVKETDANGKVTTYQYDDLNRLTKTTYPDTTYGTKTYDNDGNLKSLTDPKGDKIAYSYDALNRLTTITYPDSSTVSYTYDSAGNRLTKTDTGSTGYYTYDTMNRLTNETDLISSAKYQVLYTYDKASNILSVKYPDGSTDSFTYDALNRVSRMNGGSMNFTYTLDDKISTIKYGNGVQTTYSYNNRDMPTRILALSGSTKEMDLNYTYDAVGNVQSINNENYTNDWLNRVSTSAGPWGSISYKYDGAGNIVSITQNSVKTTYGYSTYNRLTSVGSATLTYDNNGNLVKLVNGSTTWQYSYDYENRLATVKNNNVTVQTNTYDSDGRRVEAVQGGQTTVYVYEGKDLIYEKNTGSGAVDKYYYANGLMLDETCECGYSYYYLNDALGSVRQVMQSTNLLYSSDYKPFGANYQKDGQTYFQFSGKPIDGSTGLYYFGARFYNPSMQRFITEDTFPGIKDDPQSLNRYAYVEDNPLSRTDPTGNCAVVYACPYTPPPPAQTTTATTTYTQCPYCGSSTPLPSSPPPPPALSSPPECPYCGSGSSASSNTAVNASPAASSGSSTSAMSSKKSGTPAWQIATDYNPFDGEVGVLNPPTSENLWGTVEVVGITAGLIVGGSALIAAGLITFNPLAVIAGGGLVIGGLASAGYLHGAGLASSPEGDEANLVETAQQVTSEVGQEIFGLIFPAANFIF